MLGFLASSGAAHATIQGAVGTISSLRTYTLHAISAAANNFTIFQLSPAMGNGCTWAWIEPSDKSSLAMLLAAKGTGVEVTINFDDTVFPPWAPASGICVLTNVQMN